MSGKQIRQVPRYQTGISLYQSSRFRMSSLNCKHTSRISPLNHSNVPATLGERVALYHGEQRLGRSCDLCFSQPSLRSTARATSVFVRKAVFPSQVHPLFSRSRLGKLPRNARYNVLILRSTGFVLLRFCRTFFGRPTVVDQWPSQFLRQGLALSH